MLRGLLWFGQFVVVVPAIYESIISLWGLRSPRPVRDASDPIRIRAVVAAHDEENVIEGIASDLASQQYPDSHFEACVIADRCTDRTAERASRFTPVVRRSEGSGGKGAAIAWYLASEPLAPDEALLVLDADNRIGDDFVRSVANTLSDGHPAVQAYLDVSNPDASILTLANALTYWASNRSVQLARSNLGWSCDLGGTGMAVTSSALADAGGFTDDLTEDLALNVRLNIAGHRTYWMHHTRVRDEKPATTGAALTQRSRWAKGKARVRRRFGVEVLKQAWTQRQPALLDLGVRLYNPGRSLVALVLGSLTVLAALFPHIGLWPWWLLGAIAVIVVALPLLFLIIDGIPGRYVIRYPYVTLIAILWIPVRIGARFVGGWQRTPHGG